MMKLKKLLGGIRFMINNKKEKHYPSIINKKQVLTIKGTVSLNRDVDTDWYNSLAQNSKYIYEIGCNIGQTAIYALTNNNVEKIALIDANPEALIIANKNMIINNWIHKTNSFLGFVGDKNDDEIDFFAIGYGAAGSMYKSHSQTAASINSHFKVNTITLDTLGNYFKWIPDFIKIDVEGAEEIVLNGGKKMLSNNNIKVLVEMHSNDELSMLDNGNSIIRICNEIGYSAWYLKTNEKISSGEQISDRGRCHLLLLPSNVSFPSYLK